VTATYFGHVVFTALQDTVNELVPCVVKNLFVVALFYTTVYPKEEGCFQMGKCISMLKILIQKVVKVLESKLDELKYELSISNSYNLIDLVMSSDSKLNEVKFVFCWKN